MLRKILAALSMVFALACVSTPEPIDLSEPPASAPTEVGNGMAEVVVVRPGWGGFAVTFGVWVNDENIGGIRSRDYVRKLVPPGRVQVKVTAEANCEASFPVEANRAYYLEASPKMGWWYARVQLQLMDPEEGRAAMEKSEDQTRQSARPPSP